MAGWRTAASAVPFGGLLLAVVWAPWPLASNRPFALGLLAMLVWSALAWWAVVQLLPADRRGSAVGSGTSQLGAVKWPLGMLLGFACLVAAQLLPGLGAQGGPISIEVFATQNYLLATLTYLGAALLVWLTVHGAQRTRWLLLTVVGTGIAQAFAAVMLAASGAGYRLFDTGFDAGGRASGTFANPDHMAGYMELCLSAGVGFLLASFATRQASNGKGWRGWTVAVLSFGLSAKMLVRVMMVIMVVALVMTHSRMGNGAFFLALLLGGAIIAAASATLRKPALWLVASMAVIDVVVVGQWVGIDRVAQRISDTVEASAADMRGATLEAGPAPREDSLAERLTVPRLSLGLVAQRPWLGHGGGTYYTAFPPLKVPGLPWHWDHAHNDYVQVASDTGLVGLALWLGFGVMALWRAVQLLRTGSTPEALGVGSTVLLAVCALGLHTWVDFNLHIPANALTFTVLLAAVWAVPSTPVARRHRRRRSSVEDS